MGILEAVAAVFDAVMAEDNAVEAAGGDTNSSNDSSGSGREIARPLPRWTPRL
jgi:hypothetical protein